MRRAAVLLALCCACGGGTHFTNDGLFGTWVASFDDGSITMVLIAGPDGVHGTVTGSGNVCPCMPTTVTTLPDNRLRWTGQDGKTQDFEVRTERPCSTQSPLTESPLQIQAMRLSSPPQPAIRFVRISPTPAPCPLVPEPP